MLGNIYSYFSSNEGKQIVYKLDIADKDTGFIDIKKY